MSPYLKLIYLSYPVCARSSLFAEAFFPLEKSRWRRIAIAGVEFTSVEVMLALSLEVLSTGRCIQGTVSRKELSGVQVNARY